MLSCRRWSCWWRKWSAALQVRSAPERPCAESWNAFLQASSYQVEQMHVLMRSHSGGFSLVCVCVFNIVCISDSGLIWWQRRIKLVANLWNDQECFPASDGPGLMDPCEKEPTDVLDNMVPQDREEITVKAQVTAVWARVKRRSATRSRGDSAPGPETASREQPQPPTSSLYRSIQLY